jgi:hypothetical protein
MSFDDVIAGLQATGPENERKQKSMDERDREVWRDCIEGARGIRQERLWLEAQRERGRAFSAAKHHAGKIMAPETVSARVRKHTERAHWEARAERLLLKERAVKAVADIHLKQRPAAPPPRPAQHAFDKQAKPESPRKKVGRAHESMPSLKKPQLVHESVVNSKKPQLAPDFSAMPELLDLDTCYAGNRATTPSAVPHALRFSETKFDSPKSVAEVASLTEHSALRAAGRGTSLRQSEMPRNLFAITQNPQSKSGLISFGNANGFYVGEA